MWNPISFFGTPRGSRPARRRSTRKPLVERLEDRSLLAYDFGYALGLGSAGIDSANQMATDASGNMLVTGSFRSASLDLDPGPGTYLLTNGGASDGFAAKYDPAGNLAWGVQVSGIGNGSVFDVEADKAGNVLIAGYFAGTIEIGAPGRPPVTITNSGSDEGFMAKLDAAGNVLWATTFGAAVDPRMAGGIAVDAVGNVYATGSEGKKLFVAKYGTGGTTVWTKVISEGTGITNSAGSTSYAYGQDVAVDASGNVHVTGGYLGKIDFNIDPKKTNSLTSIGWQQISYSDPDAFVLKLNASGAYVWAGSIGGSWGDGGLGIALDAAGNVHVNGYCQGDPEADFDPGRGKLTLPGNSNFGFVVKLDPNRNLLWARRDVGRYGIALDGAGAVYTTAGFAGTFDADPGPGTFTLTAAGRDVFVSKLNSAGSFVWAGALGGPGAVVESYGITVDGQGNILTTGKFQGTADFDPGAGTYPLTSTLDSSGNPTLDAFVSKLAPVSALQAAGGTAPNAAGGANLSAEQVQPLFAEALARWQVAGVDTSAIAGIDVRIADLGGTTLGLASGNTLWLDDNAAGWGWFVDATPWDDSEFALPGNQGEQDRMDLLTVVMHELGHVLGHNHDADGLMAETLAAGERRTALEEDHVATVDQVFTAPDGLYPSAWLSSVLAEQLETNRPGGRQRR